jgi:hypothetical protein
MVTRGGRWSYLKAWGVRLAQRSGFKVASTRPFDFPDGWNSFGTAAHQASAGAKSDHRQNAKAHQHDRDWLGDDAGGADQRNVRQGAGEIEQVGREARIESAEARRVGIGRQRVGDREDVADRQRRSEGLGCRRPRPGMSRSSRYPGSMQRCPRRRRRWRQRYSSRSLRRRHCARWPARVGASRCRRLRRPPRCRRCGPEGLARRHCRRAGRTRPSSDWRRRCCLPRSARRRRCR